MDYGFRRALTLFRIASKQVPAYKKFLASNKINAYKIHSYNDFLAIPLIEKKNYINKYPLSKLFPNEKIPPFVYASSGSSGKPTFWFRSDEQERIGTDIHEKIFSDIFGIRKEETTLVIICFSMGIWIAGNYTLSACRGVARRGYALTIVTPGLEREDIFYILKTLAPKFKNIILAGYPPFLMDIVVEVNRQNIKLNSHIFTLTAGDKFTEEWRDAFLKLLKVKNQKHIISIYGSADAGVLGYETPFSIALRRASLENQGLYRALFDEELILPALIQYDPKHIFFETIKNELIFTANTANPLIRYNIHDEGKIFTMNEIRDIVRKYKLSRYIPREYFKQWNMPFIIKKGRSDVAVTFYAINIYPENIKTALEVKKVSKLVSGQFFAYNKNINHQKTQKLYIQIELAKGIKPKKKYIVTIQKEIIETLRKLSIEYRKLYETIGIKAIPKVQIALFGSTNFQTKSVHGILNIKGKKARILNS